MSFDAANVANWRHSGPFLIPLLSLTRCLRITIDFNWEMGGLIHNECRPHGFDFELASNICHPEVMTFHKTDIPLQYLLLDQLPTAAETYLSALNAVTETAEELTRFWRQHSLGLTDWTFTIQLREELLQENQSLLSEALFTYNVLIAGLVLAT